MPGGITKSTYLQVRNRSDRPIIVSWDSGPRKGQFAVAQDHSLEAIVAAAVGGKQATVIDAGETKDLLLLKPSDAKALHPNAQIACDLYWRYAQPKIWPFERRVRVRIPKRSMMVLDPHDYADCEG